MSRIRIRPLTILSAATLTAALLSTACSDSTAPSDGEGPGVGNPAEQLPAKSDRSNSTLEGPDLSAASATLSPVQGADSVAQTAAGPDSLAEPVPAGARPGDIIPGQYIVMFKDDVADAPGLAKRLMAQHRGALHHTFQVFKGFSAHLSTAAADALRHNPNVSVVEPNRVVTSTATENIIPNSMGQVAWGLDRIDQVFRPLSHTMTYMHTGLGVTAYIIDTGIWTAHGEFGGRASSVYSVFGDNGYDCAGHGTHVAGIVGGTTYGVAKQVQLRSVKVLDCQKPGSSTGVAMGIDWVYRNHVNPAVANISIGTCVPNSCTPSPAIDSAATNLAKSGVFVAVAAGNSSTDACQSSPARAPGTFTVAASTSADARASYSNWGACVDAYAPGDQILSAGLGLQYSAVMSGTSMAAPHVAGVAALYKQAYGNVASATLVSVLKSWATANVISGGGYGGTPNRLLYKGGL
jgi:subtilisin family serine protease